MRILDLAAGSAEGVELLLQLRHAGGDHGNGAHFIDVGFTAPADCDGNAARLNDGRVTAAGRKRCEHEAQREEQQEQGEQREEQKTTRLSWKEKRLEKYKKFKNTKRQKNSGVENILSNSSINNSSVGTEPSVSFY